MLFYCGGSYRVAASINRIVHEGTGELLMLKTPSILLEGVTSWGEILSPQNEYYFWREIWLEPEPSPAAEVSAGGGEVLLTAEISKVEAPIARTPDTNYTKT